MNGDKNPKLFDWLENDEVGLFGVVKLIGLYGEKGWTNVEKQPFELEDEETKHLSKLIIQQSIDYFKRSAAS